MLLINFFRQKLYLAQKPNFASGFINLNWALNQKFF